MTKKINIKGKLVPRPYARLLTMIGEQLIKNEKVALIELIKNSYDADANWVQVRFNNFEIDEDDENILVVKKNSNIEIEDDGEGMTFNVIRDAWMNPATPIKLMGKKRGVRKTKINKRIIQGEKGIGRYATFKLGRKVEIVTKSKNKREIYINSDLTNYDDEIITKKGSKNPQYLDQIKFDYEIRSTPKHFVSSQLIVRGIKKNITNHGTVLKISYLTDNWTRDKIENIFYDLLRLESPFTEEKNKKDFIIDFKLNGKTFVREKMRDKNLNEIFDSAPIRVTDGMFDGKKISFTLNGRQRRLTISDLKSNKAFKDRLIDVDGKLKRVPACGPFEFEFYVYDLTVEASPKYKLDKDAKKIVKANRIYLYRDGIRVFPYGDQDDDWLGIDVERGISRAGFHLSNDQTVGRINISNEYNPKLKDKTNREGLLEIGNSYEDFRVIIKSILSYLHSEYKKYKLSLERKDKNLLVKSDEVLSELKESIEHLADNKVVKAKNVLAHALRRYEIEKKYLVERAEISEDLAAVGLAVEIASHDLMMMISRATNSVDDIIKTVITSNYDEEILKTNLETLRGQISFIESQIEGIQPIFKSSKRRSKDFRIKDVITKIQKYFLGDIGKNKIKVKIEAEGSPLVVRSNEAILLQIFINLFDNSIYWLSKSDVTNKEIKIILNGNKLELIFSDNGPGVREDDVDFIFEPFFSTKGIEGRGLGLYITDQLLQRYDHTIEYMLKKKILPGANFLIRFNIN